MTKATHTGTCQVCGNDQAVNIKTGELSLHGYTVDYGWFNGQCSGSQRLPLQHEKELALKTVLQLKGLQNKLQVKVDQGTDGITKVDDVDIKGKTIFKNEEEWNLSYHYMSFADKQRSILWKMTQELEAIIDCIRIFEDRIQNVFGTELYPIKLPKKIQEVFDSYRDAYARGEQAKEEGFKVIIRRSGYGYSHTVHMTEVI